MVLLSLAVVVELHIVYSELLPYTKSPFQLIFNNSTLLMPLYIADMKGIRGYILQTFI